MTIWRGKDPLILASQSRARQNAARQCRHRFEAVPADIDERGVQTDSGLSAPGEIACCWRARRRCSVSSQKPGRYVVGADQTLALGDGCSTSQPAAPQAAEQLRALAGHTHELHSAVAVARDGKIVFAEVAVARMTMRRLGEAEIEAYLDQAGEAVTIKRRRLSARRAWRASVRADRGRSFHHSGPAAVATAGISAQRTTACGMNVLRKWRSQHADPGTDRLDRNGKVDHRKTVRGGRRARLRRRRRGSRII